MDSHRMMKAAAAALVWMGIGVLPAGAQSPPGADAALLDDLVAANRILYDQAVVDGFGHVSVRDPKNPERFFMARSMAPGLVTTVDVQAIDMQGTVMGGDKRPAYLERFIHSGIYKVRPDVKAIVHSHSPAVIPFGVTDAGLRPIYHMSSFLGGTVPVFEISKTAGDSDMLVRNQKLGDALAESLGKHPVALMRGHGSVAVGESLLEVVFRAVYTETNARLQADAMKLGSVRFLSAGEAELAMKTNKGIQPRAWELWKKKVMAQK
jgi:HCOMODA/2-hydroxy-3-carboxy-muconic semialdehyde decarboxylase